MRRTKSASSLVGQAVTAPQIVRPQMRSRGKSNSSLSIGTLLSGIVVPCEHAIRVSKEATELDNSGSSVHQRHLSSNYASNGADRAQDTAAFGHFQREISAPHLDLNKIRLATRCTSALSSGMSSEPSEVDAFLERHRWNNNTGGCATPSITHMRQLSSRMASTRQDVYSPSIYSRPGSPGRDAALVREWPLKNETNMDEEDGSPDCPSAEPPAPPPSVETTSINTETTPGSPPKKLVQKRRSIFRFLRPGSRKAVRSVSSPALTVRTPMGFAGNFDGPADERDILTVQYELTAEHPFQRRSVTASDLLSIPQDRRGTLADYERALTSSDDRRRPSAFKLQEISEDESEAQPPNIIRRRLSRAHALETADEAGKSLMGQALRKHQQEKAMFRSESKRKESTVAPPSPIIFSGSPFATGGSSVGPPSSAQDPPEAPPNGRTRASAETLPSAKKPSPTTPKIRSSLASWSRFPSHTRNERCASASKADNIITRDFAIDIDPHAATQSSPLSERSTQASSRRSRHSLLRVPSRTFSKIVRYYSDLFTRDAGFRGGNRRTSVSASTGVVVHPELEMLPPIAGSETHHDGAKHEHLKSLEEHLDRQCVAAEEPKYEEGVFARERLMSMDEEGLGPLDGAGGPVRRDSKLEQERSRSRVREFPSVTVKDDCQGHRASISLVARQ